MLERLRVLPVVFTGADVMRLFGWSPQHATEQLIRWKRIEAVRALGGRSDLYFNLICDPAWDRHLPVAIARAMPSAVVTGATPLHTAGWVTQRPRVLDLAVLRRSPAFTLDTALVHPRNAVWYRAVQPGIDRSGAALLHLSAPWALADSLLDSGLWAPDPDELYCESDATNVLAFGEALVALAPAYARTVARPTAAGNMERVYTEAWEALRRVEG